jgi:hypothetical protein
VQSFWESALVSPDDFWRQPQRRNRFEAEPQALATMDHLDIAKALDASQFMSGRPYSVMDVVKGIPVTDYCDQAQVTPRERMEMFGHAINDFTMALNLVFLSPDRPPAR